MLRRARPNLQGECPKLIKAMSHAEPYVKFMRVSSLTKHKSHIWFYRANARYE
ncbi:hypothetical protein LBYZC6_00690 [Lacrimispora brassicae]